MTRIYTKTGDAGETGLIGGARVLKDDARIEAFGTVDELNAAVGAVLTALAGDVRTAALVEVLAPVQHRLFDLGSLLACPPETAAEWKLPALHAADVTALERSIDALTAELPELKQFIVPGGTEAAARLHTARTVCRRAERRIVSLGAHGPLPAHGLVYLNRLSDWLFVAARFANHAAGVGDVPWRPGATGP